MKIEKKFHNNSMQHAWEWFALHSNQRIELFKTYAFLTAAMIGGYLTAVSNKHFLVSIFISLLIILCSMLFYFLDSRTSQLIKISEHLINEEEKKLSECTGSKNISLIELSEEKLDLGFGKVSYASSFRIFFASVSFLSFLMIIFSIVSLGW